MDWEKLDEWLIMASFAAPTTREPALDEIQKWFDKTRSPDLTDGSSGLFEHFESRVLHFQYYFNDQFQKPGVRWIEPRLAHTAAQAALSRGNKESGLLLANSALRSICKIVETGEGDRATEKEKAATLRKNAQALQDGKHPDPLFISSLQSLEGAAGNAALFASDILRVRALTYSLYGSKEMLQMADRDLDIALALLTLHTQPPEPDDDPPGDRSMKVDGPFLASKKPPAFIFSDHSVNTVNDVPRKQYISLLRQQALVNLELGVFHRLHGTLDSARHFFAETAKNWGKIRDLLGPQWERKPEIAFEAKLSLLLLALVRDAAGGESIDSLLSEFYQCIDWASESAKEAKAVLKLLPKIITGAGRGNLTAATLNVVLNGRGMTPAKWKEILQTLLEQDWEGIDIQEIIGQMLTQFAGDVPENKDRFLSVWLEVIYQRAKASRATASDEVGLPVGRVLTALRDLMKDNASAFRDGPSMRSVLALKPSLESASPACQSLVLEILRLAREAQPGETKRP